MGTMCQDAGDTQSSFHRWCLVRGLASHKYDFEVEREHQVGAVIPHEV